jgi:1,4-dihydroxy-2-naphthoyl-CoA hydrolase
MIPPTHYSFTVRLHDIDAAGVMFFGHLFRHAHDAYESVMAGAGLPLERLIQAGVRLPLVHAEADYRRALCQGDEIRVEVACTTLGGSAFTLDYRFCDADGALRATARTVHVHLGPDGTGSARLPPDIRSALASLVRTGPREAMIPGTGLCAPTS